MDIELLLQPHIRPWSQLEIVLGLLLTLLVLLVVLILTKKKYISVLQGIMLVAFYSYYLVIYGSCVFTRTSSVQSYNLQLFWSWKEVLKGDKLLLIENIMNIIMFIPLGMIYRLIDKKIFHCIIVSFFLTALIEFSQLLFHRGFFEFDDIAHNILGAIIGFGVVNLFVLFYQRNKLAK